MNGPVDWHIKDVENREKQIALLYKNIQTLQEEIECHKKLMALSVQQIVEAKRLGMNSFDSSSFLLPKPIVKSRTSDELRQIHIKKRTFALCQEVVG
jgi:hypothetical protein